MALSVLENSQYLPPTPPTTVEDPDSTRIIDTATNVLCTAATALSLVTRLYQTDSTAKEGLLRATEQIVDTVLRGGKTIVCGIGKSGIVGMKLVATMKSLGISCSFMHAAEALHGDLGDIRPHDCILFISYSGTTPELIALLPHIPYDVPRMAITAHRSVSTCPLLACSAQPILLPAPIHEPEEVSFGVRAPTTSTTVAIAVGDALAIAVAERLHVDREGMKDVFDRNHPGGSIGAANMRQSIRKSHQF